jgi:hypothetical protein
MGLTQKSINLGLGFLRVYLNVLLYSMEIDYDEQKNRCFV